MRHNIEKILELSSDKNLAKLLIDTFIDVERGYFLKSWKTSELDAGHFVEAVRRFIEFKLNGSYTAIGTSLTTFNVQVLNAYENKPGQHESYRILIPRVLYSIYCIRNKRGVGHLGSVSPNHSDATYILSSVKWVLAEIIRLNSNIPADETTKILDHLNERNIEGVWEVNDKKRILLDGLNLKQKILFLLHDSEQLSDNQLFEYIEYSNRTYFKKSLKELHKCRLIEYSLNGKCTLSVKGVKEVESFLLKNNT